ncbi:hypothetical protein LOD99_9694 [Oopsacas minuta]|uniref:Protein kinase domain-containing protein n=1 Tax=Oopsacas minuta TaxID=111878 RepID=A0AAV7KSJ2_9METZ|nr:hypothetical protein LOD99_9694 [Oopsacas minuta]
MIVNIFMEFVAGGSVARLLKTYGPFEESFLRNYTRQIVSGVKYLHSKNVIHRDVKGDNIMVEPSGCIKLIDFGCARAFRDESATLTYDKFTMLCKSMKGTVYWMAPEVIREEEYNEKADIWSIGCTVFEMATGKPPWAFKDISQEAALFRIGMGYDLPQLPDTLSDGVKAFINRCLQQDPSNRPSAKQLLLTQFLRESF